MKHVRKFASAAILLGTFSCLFHVGCATTEDCGGGVVADTGAGESCCGGQVIGSGTACCEGVPVNDDSGITPSCESVLICGGDVFPAAGTACCGTSAAGSVYDVGTESCCFPDGVPTVQPVGEVCEAEPEPEFCGVVELGPNEACCVADPETVFVYEVGESLCCDGRVVPAAQGCESAALCGGTALGEGLECCGDDQTGTPFDPASDRCCDGDVVDIAQDCQVVVNECGGLTWPEDRECCGDDEVGTLYDPAGQQCCNEATGLVASSDAQCPSVNLCGGEPFALGESCCGDAENGTVYDADEQRCCSLATQRLVDITESCDRLCGGFALEDAFECCGSPEFGLGYNPRTQQCCDAETANVIAIDATCEAAVECGGTALIAGQECCGNAVTGAAYSPSVQRCCDAASADVRPTGVTCDDLEYGTWAFATACGGDIYFADLFNGIYRADGETLSVTLFATGGFVTSSFCDGDALVWSDLDAGILRKPLAGGDATLLFGSATTQAFELIAVDNYIVYSQNATTTSIYTYNRDTEEILAIAANQQFVQHLASDGIYVYWIDRAGFSPVVRRMRLDGVGTVEIILSDLRTSDRIYELVIADGRLYMASQDAGRILSTPLDGAPAVTVVSAVELRPYSITADAEAVYWRDESNGSIRRYALTGGAITTPVEVAGGGLRGDVVISGDYVYAVDTSTHRVYRAAR